MRERIGEVILHLSLNNKPLKSGKYVAYIRVQHKAANRYYSCHSEFTRKEWERFEKTPEHDHPVTIAYNNFKEAVKTLVREEDFSFNNLSAFTRRNHGNTVQDIISDYSKDFRKMNKHNTADMYRNLGSCIDKFLEGKQMPVAQFTTEKCKAFLAWLANERKNGPTTINMKAKNLSAVLQRAVKLHMIPHNPMNGVKRPQIKRRNLYISDQSLSRLLHATEEEIGPENLHYLQYWRASYYGNGMNVKDLLLLKRSQIHGAEIIFSRKKTQETSDRLIHVPITPQFNEALTAISGGKEYIIPEMDGYIPGSFEEYRKIRQVIKNINNHLRNITEILRIPEKITTGNARHLFGTRLSQAGIPIAYISDAMGHSRITTTQRYLDGYTFEQRKQAAAKLEI